jgi:hypothetical protein
MGKDSAFPEYDAASLDPSMQHHIPEEQNPCTITYYMYGSTSPHPPPHPKKLQIELPQNVMLWS